MNFAVQPKSPGQSPGRSEEARAKRKKRMARGFTNLQGDERITVAFQRVFKMMGAKEQRDDKIQKKNDAIAAEKARIKAEKAAQRRKERLAKRKHDEEIKKLGNEGIRAVKNFLRKGEVAGLLIGDLLDPKMARKKARARARQQKAKEAKTSLPTAELIQTGKTSDAEAAE